MTDEEGAVGDGDRRPDADADAGTTADADETRGGDDRTEGTFLVTAADESSAVLRDVDTGRVHTLSDNPGIEADDAVEGVVAPEPPLAVAWRLVEVTDRRPLSVETSDETPTARAREVAADQAVGELTRLERAGVGELHVLTVPDEGTEAAVADVLDDREGLLARAARLGVRRVEVRSTAGVVVVRYMP